MNFSPIAAIMVVLETEAIIEREMSKHALDMLFQNRFSLHQIPNEFLQVILFDLRYKRMTIDWGFWYVSNMQCITGKQFPIQTSVHSLILLQNCLA